MTITKQPTLIVISDIVNGKYVKHRFIGYSIREAGKKFKEMYSQPESKTTSRQAN